MLVILHLRGVMVSAFSSKSADSGSNSGQSVSSSLGCLSFLFGLADEKSTWRNLWMADCGDPVVIPSQCQRVIVSNSPQAQEPQIRR